MAVRYCDGLIQFRIFSSKKLNLLIFVKMFIKKLFYLIGLKQFLKSQWQCTQYSELYTFSSTLTAVLQVQIKKKTKVVPWVIYLSNWQDECINKHVLGVTTVRVLGLEFPNIAEWCPVHVVVRRAISVNAALLHNFLPPSLRLPGIFSEFHNCFCDPGSGQSYFRSSIHRLDAWVKCRIENK